LSAKNLDVVKEATLISRNYLLGTCTVLNAEGLPSGVYFYRLYAQAITGGQAGTFMEARKFILMK
jgi:hypothetical protein